MPALATAQAEQPPVTLEQVRLEKRKRLLRRSFLAYFKFFSPAEKLVMGRQTIDTCERLQAAYDRYKQGVSSYLILNWPFRHGKSEITECFAAWFYGNETAADVIICAYGADLAEGHLSLKSRGVFQKSCWIWDLKADSSRWALSQWGAAGKSGSVSAMGVGGSITGKGAALLAIDDPYKNREEAESETIRAGVLQCFESDLMTRRAPVHIVVLLMNRWHVLDVCETVISKSTPGHEKYDPEFPNFDVVKYPAQSERWITPENPYGWLFPERYDDNWYLTMRASMGGEAGYAWSCQGLQEPFARHGNMLKIEGIKIVPVMKPGLRWRRGWDLASTEAERVKDDPDFTVGTKAAIDNSDNSLSIENIKFAQLTADERDDLICETAISDGPQVQVWIEGVAGYVDTYNRVKKRLRSHGIDVRLSNPRKSKEIRAEQLESYFATGHVYMLDAPWNERAKREYGLFPGGEHDDFVDSLVNAVDDAITERHGEAAFASSDNAKLKLKVQPLVECYFDPAKVKARRDWCCYPKGSTKDIEGPYREHYRFARFGDIHRVMWLARSAQSGCIWVHVDRAETRLKDLSPIPDPGGCWTVFDALRWPAGTPLDAIARDVTRNSIDPAGYWHDYDMDSASGNDSESLLFGLSDIIEREAKFKPQSKAMGYVQTPSWIEPETIRGKRGLDIVDDLRQGAIQKRVGPMILVWPENVIKDLDDVKLKSQTSEQRIYGEARDDLADGPLSKCLRLLAVLLQGG